MTYSDVGGCKEQIEKLKEVVETPLLHVSGSLDVVYIKSILNTTHTPSHTPSHTLTPSHPHTLTAREVCEAGDRPPERCAPLRTSRDGEDPTR